MTRFSPLALAAALTLASALPTRACAPDAELIADLPLPAREADAEFRSRLEAGFPIGSPASQLVEILTLQGFQVRPQRASLTWSFQRCPMEAVVTWQADAQGRLTQLKSRYGCRRR